MQVNLKREFYGVHVLTTEIQQAIATIRESIAAVIFGQEEIITETMATLFTGGHILTTGAPGLAKTTLVKAFAAVLGLEFRRIQFTPDLLPSDITGSEILTIDQESGKRYFEFVKGPVFTNLLLADEINRASPRTQSALLEAMQERTVTAAGRKYELPEPFMVFATRNPYEAEGTFALPEAQIDRFLSHALITYPDLQAETRLLKAYSHNKHHTETDNLPQNSVSAATLRDIIAASAKVAIAEELIGAITELVRSTRPNDPLCPATLRPNIIYGASPRAGLSLIALSKSLALLQGDTEVRWQHVVRMAKPALRHRLRLSSAASRAALDEDSIITALLDHLVQRDKALAQGS